MRIADSLTVNWSIPPSSSFIDTAAALSTAQSLLSTGTPNIMQAFSASGGTADDALAKAARKIDVTYQLPYVAHACMEVLNCTAQVSSGSCEIWAPTQGQGWCVETAKALLGLTDQQVTVHTTLLGGGLGRKIEQDFIAQAILIAKAVGQPVKLTWARKQDFKNDKYRPSALIHVQAGLDSGGNFASLIYRNVSPSITVQRGWGPASADSGAVEGATHLPYSIANGRIEFIADPAAIPVGWWRSVGNSYNVFAVESAVDELAGTAGYDPIAFRQKLLVNDARGSAILKAISTWNAQNSMPSGRARGVAFTYGFGSYIGLLLEISLNSSNAIKVNRVFCAVDCGTAVNPDSVEAQMQGGIVHGLSSALWGQVTFTQGSPNVSNFNTYRMLRLSEMPSVTVQIINSGGPIGGIGETGVPCVAPALANAYARLTGTRVRTLPFYPGATMGGL
jgi:isoquinoline 1-oxidoreductase beta subunit